MSAPQHVFSPHRTEDVLNTYNSLLHEADAYISFFKKRCEIEEEFQSQLFKLSTRQLDSDRKLISEHPDLGPVSARLAWQEITCSVQQEAQLRKNWVRKIREHVIDPLEKFRSIKERTLNRIRDDLRNSVNDHKEYLATVQRLKKQYDRKCEEVQQHLSMIEAVEVRDKLIDERQAADWERVIPGTTNSSPPAHENFSNHSSPPPYHSRRSGELAGHHQTSFNGPIGSHPNLSSSTPSSARTPFIISGATSTALRDTAIPVPANPLQAKGNDVLHALRNNTNNLIQRLNSRKENKSASGNNPSSSPDDGTIRPSALRGVKLKREAEDADRDYRKGVFHLETLRLRKEQVIRGARRATEDMVFETSGEAKDTFAYYIDETRMAAVSRISICDHAQFLVDRISPDEDAHAFAVSQPGEFSEPKVLYENAFTGPCQSLLFGVAINDYYASHPGKGWVPLLVRICIDEIEKRGIHLEGIYRVSGKMQSVTQLVNEIEKDEDAFRFDADRHDPYTISGVLKLYLRQLPVPLFTFPLVDRVAFSNNIEEHRNNGFGTLIKKVRKLPATHQATLKLVCEHLHRVSLHSDKNKMTSSNLGLVFAPAIFSEETGTQLPPQAWKDLVMEVLIDHHEDVFEGLPIADPSGGSGTRSQRASFVARPSSPSTRKSLEAEQYESYSRSVSPNRTVGASTASAQSQLYQVTSPRPTEPNPPLPQLAPPRAFDLADQFRSKRTSFENLSNAQLLQMPPNAQSHHLPPTTHVPLRHHETIKIAKRSFSLRKKPTPSSHSSPPLGKSALTPSRASLDSHRSQFSDPSSIEQTFHQGLLAPDRPGVANALHPTNVTEPMSTPPHLNSSPQSMSRVESAASDQFEPSPMSVSQPLPSAGPRQDCSITETVYGPVTHSSDSSHPPTVTTEMSQGKSLRRTTKAVGSPDACMPVTGLISHSLTSPVHSSSSIQVRRDSESAVEELATGPIRLT